MRWLTPVLFGLVLACPLVAIPGTGFDSFRLPVALALAGGLLGAAFVRSSRGGARPPGPAPLRTAGLLLLGAHLLSLLVARSIAEAIPPTLTLAAGLAVFSCLRGGLLRKEQASALLPVISGTALCIAGIGLVQRLLHQEAIATEGNRNYTGALCAILLPPTVAFTGRGRSWERLLAGIAAAGLCLLLLFSESRGGFLGAVAGLVLAGGAQGFRKVPRGAVIAGAAILILALAFIGSQGKDQMSQHRLETVVFRIETWKSGLRMFARRPVLGWGAGGFSIEYPPFRSEEEFQVSHSDGKEGFKEVEDPHSSWVAAGVETGLLGLSGLLLVVYVAARLWRYYVGRAADSETVSALSGLGGGAAAYLVAGSFNTLTSHVSHTILFWAFLGLIEILGEKREWRLPSRGREIRVGILAASAVVLAFGSFWTFRIGCSDQAYIQGMRTADPRRREAKMRESIDDYPEEWRAHYALSDTLSHLERFAGAAEEARATLQLRPYHVEALNLAAISILRSRGDTAEAQRDLRQAIEIAPFYFKSYFNLALLEGERGHSAESRLLLSESIKHKPDHAASYYYRGLAFLGEGESASAWSDFRMAAGLHYDVGAALRIDRPSALNDSRFSEFFK
jgi:O-antigen ligase